MKKIYIFTFGCSSRYLDGEKYKLFFKKNGYLITESLEEADYILLNTCAFRKNEEDIAIDRLIEFQKRKKQSAEIVIMGCLPAINNERMKKYFSGQSIIPKEITKINSLFNAKINIEDISDSNTFAFHRPKKLTEIIKTLPQVSKKNLVSKVFKYGMAKIFQNKIADEKENLYYIRIINGCLGNCSYCAIKYAIGNARSKPVDKIISEIENILSSKNNIRIALIGDDTGAYGLDINSTFADLLGKLTRIEGIKQINIEEINIHWLVKDYENISTALKNPKFKHLWLALQSGSEKILRLMNRPILKSPRETSKLLSNLKEANQNLIYKGQYIIGFPGETLEDVNLTIENILESKFDEVNLFKFDPKPNTLAEKMPDQIKDKEKNSRIRYIKNKLKNKKIKVFTNN